MTKTQYLLDYIKQNPIGLAPMAEIGDGPFRRICRAGGAGLLTAPMIAARHVLDAPHRLPEEAHFHSSEHPIGIQLISRKPEEAEKATAYLATLGYDFIELNCGCPSKRIRGVGCGAALMQDPMLLADVAGAVVEGAKDCPVSVKMRLGFSTGDNGAEKALKELNGLDLAWITIHGRFADQGYGIKADWDAIAKLSASCRFALLGNGDIHQREEAAERIIASGVIGVLVGRGAFGRPWMFSESGDPGWKERSQWAKRHFKEQVDEFGELKSIFLFRKHLMLYSRGAPGSRQLRGSIPTIKTMEDIITILDNMAEW